MISVIIPLYNKGERVKKTIESALHQDYDGEWEIVVVDDGSTDNSAEYAHAFTDKKVRYIYKTNGGVSAARNTGIMNSKGEWLVFLDADDLLLPCALSTFASMQKHYPKAKLCVGSRVWNQRGSLVSQGLDKGVLKHSTFPYLAIYANVFFASPGNMCICRTLIDMQGVFDIRLSFYEDAEFLYRMLAQTEVAFTDRIIGIYEQDGQGLSLSRHPVEKEMAYYIPEIIQKQKPGFWYKALLYENIELTKLGWQENPEITAFYNNMQREHFSWIYPKLHWLRQQLLRHKLL